MGRQAFGESKSDMLTGVEGHGCVDLRLELCEIGEDESDSESERVPWLLPCARDVASTSSSSRSARPRPAHLLASPREELLAIGLAERGR